MNITDRTTHPVLQGTGPWLRLREGFNTASEAPAALGVGKYVTRSQLMRQKHTGVSPEPDAATLGKFAAGHAAEDAARPLVEDSLGQELYPATMTAIVDGLPLLASLDGLTLEGDTAWETKLWNEELADCVRQGAHALPAHYTVQMDQEMLVSGATRCLFTCTDGTPERFVSCWYEADPAKFAALVEGWAQFERDLAAYVLPAEAEPAPVGKAPDALPALRIDITGQVTASNLTEFKATALGAIRSVNRALKTDQDFADADKAVKWCADVEDRVKGAKERALAQTADIEALFRTLDEIAKEAREVRLDLDKLVTRRKAEVRDAAVMAARQALDLHIAVVNAEIAPMRLQPVAADFAGAIKGKRSVASMQDALDTTLAAAKIAADGQGRAIRANAQAFKALAEGFEFLFADLGQLVHKPADDFLTLVGARIATHRAAEAEKARKAAEAEAARIAAAEQRAREQEAQRIAQEQAAAAEAQRRQEAAAAEAQRQAAAALAQAAAPAPAAVEPHAGLMLQDMDAGLSRTLATKPDAAMHAREAAAAIPAPAPKADEPATLKLGVICERLQFTVSAAFLADVLHVAPARIEGRAQLYTESQFRTICRQLVSHVGAMAELYAGEVVA